MKEGWITESLGDLCEFQRGLTYGKSDEVDMSENVVLRATNIDLATNLLTFDELKYISDRVIVSDSKKVRKGSLMICTASGSKSHLGKVAFIDADYGYAFGGFMGMITPRNGLLPKFLFHLMTTEYYKDFIGELSDGANINNLKFDDLRKFQIPHPPLAEQHRIVAILEEALDGITTAKAIAKKNLQNARAIFESHLQSVFTQRGPGWIDKPLGDLCDFLNGFAFKSGDAVAKSQTQLVRIGNLFGSQLDLNRKPVFYPDRFATDYSRYVLVKGDIIMSLTGTTDKEDYGFAVRVSDSGHNLLMNQRLMKFEAIRRNIIDDGFLLYYLRSRCFLDILYPTANGTRQANLSSATMKLLPVPLPSLKEQKEISNKLDSLTGETQRLTRLYEMKLTALEALKKSILHQTFNGQI